MVKMEAQLTQTKTETVFIDYDGKKKLIPRSDKMLFLVTSETTSSIGNTVSEPHLWMIFSDADDAKRYCKTLYFSNSGGYRKTDIQAIPFIGELSHVFVLK